MFLITLRGSYCSRTNQLKNIFWYFLQLKFSRDFINCNHSEKSISSFLKVVNQNFFTKLICSSLFFDLINFLICDLTFDVATNLSHKGDGWDSFEVKISTWSPFLRIDFKGWRFPLIFDATHLSPISEWIE